MSLLSPLPWWMRVRERRLVWRLACECVPIGERERAISFLPFFFLSCPLANANAHAISFSCTGLVVHRNIHDEGRGVGTGQRRRRGFPVPVGPIVAGHRHFVSVNVFATVCMWVRMYVFSVGSVCMCAWCSFCTSTCVCGGGGAGGEE